MSSGRCRGDRGASLVVALAFLSLFGVFSVSILALSGVATKNTLVTRSSLNKLYAADGGLEFGTQIMQTDTSYCPSSASGTQSLPDQTLNGRLVHTTCKTTNGSTGSGGPPAPTTWPLVITGYNGNTNSSSFTASGSTGATNTFTISGGPVFNAGGFSFASGNDKFVFANDVHEYDPYCTTSKSAATPGKPTVNGTWTCENSATYAVPDPAPTLIVPTATAHAPVTVGTCTILFPGKYTSANKPSFTGSGHYYFASGVYYFESLGDFPLNGDIFGGQPQAPDTQKFTVVNPCATDATANAQVAGSATGYGVEFVGGGNTKFDPTTNASSKIELFAREPATPANEGTPGVSIYAPRTAGTNYIASTAPDVLSLGGNPGQLVIHGLVYAPNANLKIWAMANSGAGNAPMLGGGLVTGALEIALNSSSTTFTIATLPTGTPATPRTVTVTSTAVGTDTGEASVSDQAVITLGTSTSTPPTIVSWHKL